MSAPDPAAAEREELEVRGPSVPMPRTGETLHVRTAEDATLAAFLEDGKRIRDELAWSENIVQAELVGRMDRALKWSREAGGYKLETSSPKAGSTEYPTDALEGVLNDLVAAVVIGPEGAETALQRKLILELELPWRAEPQAIVAGLERAITIEVAGVAVRVLKAEVVRKVNAQGVKNLAALPQARAELEKIAIPTGSASKRKVKVAVL